MEKGIEPLKCRGFGSLFARWDAEHKWHLHIAPFFGSESGWRVSAQLASVKICENSPTFALPD